MKIKIPFFILLLSIVFVAKSQTIINTPIINKYANAEVIDYCTNTIGVPPGMGGQFLAGEKILIIQMKGATLNEDNNIFNGSVKDYNNAGNYEINEVLSINSSATDDIVLKYEMTRGYNASGSVQIVSIPQYEDVIIQDTLTCLPWNGSVGGVLIFNASGKVTMNEVIDVSGKGFRGGNGIAVPGDVGCYTTAGGFTDYNCALSDICGARKGEGVGDRFIPENLGRGKNGNGGGGGNDHNAGGAGGGGFGIGGKGGERTNGFCFGYGGIGGDNSIMNIINNKIYNSGGGGAGEANNGTSANEQGATGGNAGGLVFIMADEIKANGNKIISDGDSLLIYPIEDGAGGGGAGGVVVLDITTFFGNLKIDLNGGNGGDAEAQGSCPGPGGGGSGGTLWIKQSINNPNLTLNADGGEHGEVILALCIGSSNGSENGQDGGTIFNFKAEISDVVFEKIVLNAGTDTTICGDFGAPLWAEHSSSKELDFEWTWSNGTETDEEFVFKPETGGHYEVVAKASYTSFDEYCEESWKVIVDIINPKINIVASSFFGDTVKIGEAVFVNAVVSPSNNDYTYSWSPSERVEPNDDRNAVATPYESGEFCLTVTDESNCPNTECIDLYVYPPVILKPNAFTPNADNVNNTFLPILTEDLKVINFKVYDRWGDLVYITNEHKPWDGTKDGVALPIDSYMWYLEVEQKLSLKIFKRMGNITIVR